MHRDLIHKALHDRETQAGALLRVACGKKRFHGLGDIRDANAFVRYRDSNQPPRIDGQRKHHRADPVRVSVDDAVGDGF